MENDRRALPKSKWLRLMNCMWKQKARARYCPEGPRLDGQLALVTGGSRGIGFETAKGLAMRGADVVVASRTVAKGQAVCQKLAAETGRDIRFLALDLSDLNSVRSAGQELQDRLGSRRFDIVVANAGIWPLSYSESAQNLESAFATNVLGHHLLVRNLLLSGLLKDGRVVILTGDIYAFAQDCTSNYTYRTPWGGQLAYCRSKLGNLWFAQQLQKRYPGLKVHCVHPGVVASDLGGIGSDSKLLRWVKSLFFISPEQGAQTTLLCSTQELEGFYYHNVFGQVELPESDPARQETKAEQLWCHCEDLCSEYLDGSPSEGSSVTLNQTGVSSAEKSQVPQRKEAFQCS